MHMAYLFRIYGTQWEGTLTLNSLGTMSLGVSTPTSTSTPQKTRIDRMMAKSLMSFLTWRTKKKRTQI